MAIFGNEVVQVQPGMTFELPVKVEAGMDLAALTLHLRYPEHQVRIKEVRSELKGAMTTIADGMVNIAWSDLEPKYIPSDGTLATLVLETTADLDGTQDIFSWSNMSEFANEAGETIEGVNLKIARIDNTSEYGISVYPNPVHQESTILYTLPETGHVNLTILDQFGKTIAVLKDQDEEAGNHITKFIPADYTLANGVYFCRIQVDGPTGNFSKLVKLIYIR
jgi:hypothetical protein